MLIPLQTGNGFKEKQLTYPRVKEAFQQKEKKMNDLLRSKNISPDKFEVFLRIFKSDKLIEVWGKNKSDEKYQLICQYDFCAVSGGLGPKRDQGDNQTPEGIYSIIRFNPQSSFHLSLGINYPNRSDLKFCTSGNTGGDIFIHGNCVTIGCIPITDDKIKELYVLCVMAKNNGQANIPVHIFPARLDEETYHKLALKYSRFPDYIRLWGELKPIYSYFEKDRNIPDVVINSKGEYILTQKTGNK